MFIAWRHSLVWIYSAFFYKVRDLLTYLLTYLPTYSMEQSSCWEANQFSANQEIPCILWNPKVRYGIHKCPPPVPTLTQIHLVYYLKSHFLKICLNIMLACTARSSIWSLSFTFPHQNPVYASPLSIRATCPAHLILLDLITRTILGEEYRSLSSSLGTFLHSPVTSSILGPNILLNTLFSNTLSLRSSLNVSDQVSHPYKTTGKIIVLYIHNFACCFVLSVLDVISFCKPKESITRSRTECG